MGENKQPRIKILVACHKADPNIRQDDIYMPIQVGKALHPELDLGFQCDNTGDNISEKNGSYCELTALYWAWKNLKDVDYIGLCHYRRYFKLDIVEANIEKLLNKYDVIILKKRGLPYSVETELALLTSYEDYYIFLDTLFKLYPEMKKAACKYFTATNKWSNCNMLITTKAIFDEYCEFLFPLLMETESRLKINGYTRLRRVIGYLSEPLLGFWLDYNGYKCLHVDKDEAEEIKEKRSPIKKQLSEIRIHLAFKIMHILSNRKSPNTIFEEWIKNGLRQDGYIFNK